MNPKSTSPFIDLPTINPEAQKKHLEDRNAGRDPERLAMKYAKMRSSPFVFLRGACSLYYDALPDLPCLSEAPLAWCCGDLHFENLGSYPGWDGQAYFDLNDFDEAVLAPCTWDLIRLLSSLICGADALKAKPEEIDQVVQECLLGYRDALLKGKPLAVDKGNAKGMIKSLLEEVAERNRADFLDRRTKLIKDHRQIKLDGLKALPVSPEERAEVAAFMAVFAQTQKDPHFFEVIDVARRIAGTGSLGLMRYVILVRGKGSPNGNYLLDLKAAQSSALNARLAQVPVSQPHWANEASRVVAVQNRMQASDNRFITAVEFQGHSCVLRRLHPSEDRVAIARWGSHLDHLLGVARTMGQLSAWDQLRASGRQGSAIADDLMAFAENPEWPQALAQAAAYMANVTQLQWAAFLEAPPRVK